METIMQLYHFPSTNPQKVTFALKELGLDCELVPVDLAKGEHRQPAFLAKNPFGRVPVLVDGDLTLPESHAIVADLGGRSRRGAQMAVLSVAPHIAAGGRGGAALSRESVRPSARRRRG